jgi:hypothetical protein
MATIVELRKVVEDARNNEIEYVPMSIQTTTITKAVLLIRLFLLPSREVTVRRKNALGELFLLVNAKTYTPSISLASITDIPPDAFDRFIQSPPLV